MKPITLNEEEYFALKNTHIGCVYLETNIRPSVDALLDVRLDAMQRRDKYPPDRMTWELEIFAIDILLNLTQ